MEQHQGVVAQVMGPVVDVRFGEDYLPQIYNALTLPLGEKTLTVEVAQHIGDGVVRCIAMGSTDGLQRGVAVTDTGKGISVLRQCIVVGEIDGPAFMFKIITHILIVK